ncbi:MAG: electron transporter, partial [Anaerotignum sp.]|nr:electron transporter [Anaerotignum sp.]
MDSKAIMKPAIVLLVIAGVAAALLGAVSEVTKAPIAAQEQKTLNESMIAVMPDASSFELMETELTGTITAVYAADNGGVVITTAPGGFGGAVNTMVGIGPDGVISG